LKIGDLEREACDGYFAEHELPGNENISHCAISSQIVDRLNFPRAAISEKVPHFLRQRYSHGLPFTEPRLETP
jgi:hypothetical protein